MKKFILMMSILIIGLITIVTFYRKEMDPNQLIGYVFYFIENQNENKESHPSHPEIAHLDHQAHKSNGNKHPDHENTIVLTDEQIKNMRLQILTAEKGRIFLTLSTRGKIMVDPDRLVHVIPHMPGIAKEAFKNIGNGVKKGEIIAILESEEMANLKAAYLAAISREKLALSILQREKKLYEKGVSAGEDFFKAENNFEEANINLQLAIHKLYSFGISEKEIQNLADRHDTNLRIYNIYAPIDGIIIMRHITQSEYIETAATIYEIADLSHVWVELGVYPKDLHRLKVGQIVEITDTNSKQTAEAKLIYISPMIGNETIAAKVIVLLDNPQNHWRPGSFVQVSIETDQISCPILIDKSAIQQIDGNDYAFVKNEKGFEKRELQLGKRDQHNVEVLSGILSGEKYVAKGSFLLKAELNKELTGHDD